MDITRFSVRKVGSSAINIPADIRDWLYEKGVVPGSGMPGRYVHLAANDLKKKVMEMHHLSYT